MDADAGGEIKSLNFPGKYPTSLDCEYVIKSSNGNVKYEIVSMDIEEDNTGDCEYDYLEIVYVSENKNFKYCGKDEKKSYTTGSSSIRVKFHSDAFTSNNKGFVLKYGSTGKQQEYRPIPGCDGRQTTLTDPSVSLAGPLTRSGEYPPNSDCSFLIRAPTGYVSKFS